MIASRQQIVVEANRLLRQYDSAASAFGLSLVESEVSEHQGTWLVPLSFGAASGSASDLSDLLRKMRRELESKFDQPVSVMLDPSQFGAGLNGPVAES